MRKSKKCGREFGKLCENNIQVRHGNLFTRKLVKQLFLTLTFEFANLTFKQTSTATHNYRKG